MSFVYNLKHFRLSMLLVIIMVQPLFPWCRSLASAQVLHQGCLEKCGDVEIPYPFGTTEDCYFNSKFFMRCTKDASGSPKLFAPYSVDVDIIHLSLEGQLTVLTHIGKECYYSNGSLNVDESQDALIFVPYFRISNTQNKLFAIGCDTHASIRSGEAITGCSSICLNQSFILDNDRTCSGVGCCQTTIPVNLYEYELSVTSSNNHTNQWQHNPCSYFFLAENNYYNFSEGDLHNERNISKVPTILEWVIGDRTCEDIKRNSSDYACRKNSRCVDSTNGPGYRCSCLKGFWGNPYMPDGCEDIDECATATEDPCGENMYCTNTYGGYTCSCNDGFEEVGAESCTQKPMKAVKPVIEITIGIAVGLAAFLIVGSWLFWGYNKRQHLLRRQRFFEQNGGLMLRKELSGKEGYNEAARIFTANELKQATNNFDERRIIGRGGFGTVYKGILEDDKVIAIKKSKVMDQDQIEQFINEIIVLSQINHRNVVRLLGCCLETEVPLLVYEYISNGTLHEHIHDKKNPSQILSWENRLRIAAEIAGVLAYLHSEAFVPIVHRDIKCTNILLDDNFTAKVSDFGASRLVPIDQDMLTTMVQGTIGYLDPEYLHTSQLTDKSDVYSFGVVLVELMTGKKALAFDRPEDERCLAMLFILSMKNDKLFSVIDDGLVNDGNKKQIQEAASLALGCLRVLGDERPTMRELASELHGLLLTGAHPWRDATAASEENKNLLGCQLQDGYHQSDATIHNTGARYDSISIANHVVLTVGDGS